MNMLVRATILIAVIMPGLAPSVRAAETSRVYVQFKPGQKNAARTAIQQAGGKIHYEFDSLNAVATTVPSAALGGIRKNPNVVLVEKDPPRYLMDCGGMPTEQVPDGIGAIGASALWDANNDGILDPGAPTGAGIKIGILDTGVLAVHPDLAGVPMTGFLDGAIDWRVDFLGHGTHVTGIIAAQLNGSGVVGASPGVSIFMVKVYDYIHDNDPLTAGVYWVYSSTLLDAAQRCQAEGCRIINMSLGGEESSQTESDGLAQLYNEGMLLVAAAGNGAPTTNYVSYPAGYPSVISVAAVDQNLAEVGFSPHNSDVELAAPGVDVLSTVSFDEQYYVSGTGFCHTGNPFTGSAPGTAAGLLVNGGLGDSTNAAWAGKVVLLQRGTITFAQKVLNVQNSGGLACIIYNNVPGGFEGNLSIGAWAIPALAISMEDGQALLSRLGQRVLVKTEIWRDSIGWKRLSGTSMAAPHVSAAAALLWSRDPSRSNVEIRQALAANALDLGTPGRDNATGFGLVQSSAWSPLPTLSIHRIGPTTAAVSWLSPATGYVLQQSTNLALGAWTNTSESISDNGTNKSIIINLTTSNRFFRLFKP
jgi:serine protease